jgi:NADH-quinone oxidoreductase subunit N
MIDSASLLAVLPELVLTAGGLVLMLIAAYGGDGTARVVNWLSVLTLAVAGLTLSTSMAHGPLAFDGLVRADAFSVFAKTIIYAAAAAAILLAPRYFLVGGALRPEYPVLILFSSIGMGMMVSAGDLLTLYVGLEMQSLAAYVLASFIQRCFTALLAARPLTALRSRWVMASAKANCLGWCSYWRALLSR